MIGSVGVSVNTGANGLIGCGAISGAY